MRYFFLAVLFFSCAPATKNLSLGDAYSEPHRPQIHFTPKANWMNDPNGMVYYKGLYHLFFQYYPDSTVWGPMHWGHATSKDLVHWTEEGIALYPDSLGYIFSGSIVVDMQNTSGFGINGAVPLVAIFTHHDTTGEKKGTATYQNQSLAYSLDEGKTWTKYSANPVLKNPGIKDFRDPKVMWHEESKKWIMTLAVLDRISFYSSSNLKDWKKESEFGAAVGAHGGVWECPDLFALQSNDTKVWVLIVNINPGGPNGGSGTQYFTGEFNGRTFIPHQTDTRWLDYGPDDYAGVTWSNTGARKIFLGWMSNWQYADLVPTHPWRSAMTIPRDIGIQKVGNKYSLTSQPSEELNVLNEKENLYSDIDATSFDLTAKSGKLTGPARIKLLTDTLKSFSITLFNDTGNKLIVGYDNTENYYFIDRRQSGKIDFEKGFARRHTAPRIDTGAAMDMELIIDNASVELFADGGLSTMTAIFFPGKLYSDIKITSTEGFKIKELKAYKMKTAVNHKN